MFSALWDKLDGYKAKIGGAAFILTGLGLIAKDLSDGGTFQPMEGWKMILAGWALVAGKSALEKLQ